MASNVNTIMADLGEIDGFVAAAIVDAESGMTFATAGGNKSFDIEVAAAANTQVVKAKVNAMRALKLSNDRIDDILITLTTQYHLIRPSSKNPLLFIYLALDKEKSNLGLARHYLKQAGTDLSI